jgi:hypothetical protein
LSKPEVAPLLRGSDVTRDRQVLSEFEWITADGMAYRADRLIRQGPDWCVIDFKWSVNEAQLGLYNQQLNKYKCLIENTFLRNQSYRSIKVGLLTAHGLWIGFT